MEPIIDTQHDMLILVLTNIPWIICFLQFLQVNWVIISNAYDNVDVHDGANVSDATKTQALK